MSALRIGVFVLATAAATFASGSVAIAPHDDPPGTAPVHVHGIALYRFPLALALPAPIADQGPHFTIADPLAELAGTLVLALLLFAPYRVRTPQARDPRERPAPWLAAPQWATRTVAPPPRVLTLLATR